jgi:hypothetical protein
MTHSKPLAEVARAMSLLDTRAHQMFPILGLGQIETARRFANGEARHLGPCVPITGSISVPPNRSAPR